VSDPDRPFRRRVLVNTAATAAGNGWAMVVALVTVPVLLHGLGAGLFGTWVLLQTFSAITGWISLADLGAGTATTRAVAHHAASADDAATQRTVATGMAVFAGMGVVSAVLLGLLGPIGLPALFNTPSSVAGALRTATLLFAVQVLVDLVTEGCEACLEGLQRVDLSRLLDAVRRGLVAVATCVAANVWHSLEAVALWSLIASAAGTVLAVAMLSRHVRVTRPSWSEARTLLRYARTVALLRPIGVLHRTMDRVVVGAVLGPQAVALVEIATQVQNGADSVLSATSYAVVPSASWLQSRGDEGTLRELFETGTRYSVLATYGVVVPVMVLAAPLVHLWVGDRYADAAGLSAVALVYVLATAPVAVGSNLLRGIGAAGEILKAALAAVIVNLVSSVVLVNAFGVVGAFIGTLTGTAFLIPLLSRSALRATGTTAADFVRTCVLPAVAPSAAATVVAAVAVLVPLADLARVAIGVPASLITFAVVALRWSLSTDDRSSLRSVLAGRRR
jgi:O-antigen/teichoic acid export membrane protein